MRDVILSHILCVVCIPSLVLHRIMPFPALETKTWKWMDMAKLETQVRADVQERRVLRHGGNTKEGRQLI
jgi:hypothetical protein